MEWMIFGGLAALYLTDKLFDYRREQRRAAALSAEPVCGCGHHHAFHDPADGICHGRDHVQVGVDDRLQKVYEVVACTCRQYSGPIPTIDYRVIQQLQGKHEPEA